MTCVDFGIVMHMRGGEDLVHKVSDPIRGIVVTRCDEAYLLAVEVVADVKYHATFIVMFR